MALANGVTEKRLNNQPFYGVRILITEAALESKKSKDLAQLAKKKGIQGWHSMRKAQLVKALLKIALEKQNPNGSRGSKSTRKPPVSKTKRKNQTTETPIGKRIRDDRLRQDNLKNLAFGSSINKRRVPPANDRIVLVVRDAYWLQAYWEITRATVQRARIALNGRWHQAKPVLRLLEITSDGNTNSIENIAQEIEIHSGVNNWYLNTDGSGKAYRIAIGYAAPEGKFHLIAKSNQVTPPAGHDIDESWTDITNDVEKYFVLSGGNDPQSVSVELQSVFEEKSRQLMNPPAFERLGSGINGAGKTLDFQVDAHMIVHGSTDPRASVTIAGEPVRIQDDGTFAVRMELPERRQVLPVVAASRDGTTQRTTVLAIERNTKVMEPVNNELGEQG